MSQFHLLIKRLGRVALLLGLALGGMALAAVEPVPMPWAGRSDAVFHRVLTTPRSRLAPECRIARRTTNKAMTASATIAVRRNVGVMGVP